MWMMHRAEYFCFVMQMNVPLMSYYRRPGAKQLLKTSKVNTRIGLPYMEKP